MALPFERPSATLMREYEAVARRAGTLGQRFERPNFSTANLPLEAMKTLLAALCLLPRGTAEGGRIQLIEAQDQLSDIRSTYVSLDPAEQEDAHGAPKLQRDDPLDEELGALLGAVVTALSAANREAGALMVDPPPAAHAPNDPASPEVVEAVAQGNQTAQDIRATRDDADQILKPGSQPADTLKRRLADGEGLTLAGTASLQTPSVVARWSHRISDALRKTPALLRNAANAIDTTRDVLTPFYHQVKDFQDKLDVLIAENIPKFTANLRKAADRIEFGPGGQPGDGPPPDFDIDKVHDMILAGQAPPPTWVPFIQKLNFWTTEEIRALEDLRPLSSLTALTSLNLASTHVTNLTPISGLTALTSLNLARTKVNDLTPISDLTALTSLNLAATRVTDLTPISGLTALTSLSLTGTQVTDLTPISGLTALTALDLFDTQITDLTPISGLNSLQLLIIFRTPIDDLGPVSALPDLAQIFVATKRQASALAKTLKRAHAFEKVGLRKRADYWIIHLEPLIPAAQL